MGCCHSNKKQKYLPSDIQNQNALKQNEIPKMSIQKQIKRQYKKPASIDDETFQIMEQYLTSKHESQINLEQKSELCLGEIPQQHERRLSGGVIKEKKQVKQIFHPNKLFPLKCYCPQSCLCDRKEPHVWTHDVCKSTLYLDLDGEVVCLTCQYSEFLFQHSFICPSCRHMSKFSTLNEFAQCSYQFIEDQQVKSNLARARAKQKEM